MPDSLLAIAEYSGYISIIKLVVFLILFFLWLPLVSWVYSDSENIGIKQNLWTSVVLGTAVAGTLVFLFVPVFIVGMSLYIIAVVITAVSYLKNRNAVVMDFDRILTGNHIKSLFSARQAKKLEDIKKFLFITANENEVPLPQPKTPDFYGYKAAYDILSDATWRRAEEVILSPTNQDYKVSYNIDGAALKQPVSTREQAELFIHFVKNLADLDSNEKRKPQKGKFKIRQEQQKDIDWEVTTAGSTAGEQIRLKRSSQHNILRLGEIGLANDQYVQLNSLSDKKEGLFIISGLEKSGVTTSFYAFLRNHDAFLNSIDVLERNPTAELPNITQNVFSLSDTGTTTYAKRLLRLIRMGPDILGAAECEDSESARIACQAAGDGKVVYVTIEAESVLKALGKWIKLVGNKERAIAPLIGIINQRLVRKLCPECKQAYSPNTGLLRKFNLSSEKVKALYRPGKVVYDKHGKERICESCQGTGFLGRTGIFENIAIDANLKESIKKSKSFSEINSHLRHAKMLYLQERALRRVIDGTTSVNEMIRIITPKGK